MSRQKFVVVLIVLLLIVVGCESTSEPATQPEPVEVTRIVEVTRVVEVSREVEVEVPVAAEPVNLSIATEVRTYQSANGREYTVYVYLPMSYSMTDQDYLVAYVTDGDFYTVPTGMAAGQLAFGLEVPELIVVGIGYGGSPMNSLERREEDMTLAGSPSFMQFLEEELVPDIESSYRVDSSVRTLLGHSLGGAFSLYALYHGTDTFQQIIASSPSCVEACAVLEADYGADLGTLPARLYVSMGEMDSYYMPGYEGFTQAFAATSHDGVVSKMLILDDETHLSARPRAFISGLKWLFSGEPGIDPLMMRTTQEVMDSHMTAIETLDIEMLMGDYAEDAQLLMLNGAIVSKESILTDFFQASMEQFPGMTYTYGDVICSGNVCMLEWSGENETTLISKGIGVLVIEDGMIQSQVEWFEAAAK